MYLFRNYYYCYVPTVADSRMVDSPLCILIGVRNSGFNVVDV